MIKIRLKFLALNSSGSFDKAPNPNRDGEIAIRITSDIISSFYCCYSEKDLNILVFGGAFISIGLHSPQTPILML
jgi:hypothetical protein